MFYILHKLNLFFHQIILWLYNDVDKAFSTGGFVGAGITASVFHLNYWYWAKVIVSALLGGLVNIAIKKVVNHFFKSGKEHENE